MAYLNSFIKLQDTARLFHVNGETIINRSGKSTRIPDEDRFIHSLLSELTGGVDTTRTTIYTILPGDTGCDECWRRGHAGVSEDNVALLEQELERDVLVLPPRPAVVNLVSVHTGFVMSEVIKIVTGICPPSATNKVVEFDFRSMATSIPEKWCKLPDCPVCGHLQHQDAAE